MKNVISYSLWGNDPKYWVGAIRNIELAQKYYPGWKCRFYIDKNSKQELIDTIKGNNVEVVLVDSKGSFHGMFWRFWASEDPDVDVFLSRDCDSRLSDRELSAVNEWLESDKDFHIMRDHPYHTVPILGRMWGCRNGIMRKIGLSKMIESWNQYHRKGIDQDFLAIDYWFGGIDTETFVDKKNNNNFCFIYYKNRKPYELKIVTDLLSKYRIPYQILNYGSYTQEQFIETNNNSKFGIILSNTETQGFAIMESMSMNTPLFVLDKNIWQNTYNKATSVPYFSEDCGVIINESDINFEYVEYRFIDFLSKIDNYNPRRFIEKKYNIYASIELLLKKLIN